MFLCPLISSCLGPGHILWRGAMGGSAVGTVADTTLTVSRDGVDIWSPFSEIYWQKHRFQGPAQSGALQTGQAMVKRVPGRNFGTGRWSDRRKKVKEIYREDSSRRTLLDTLRKTQRQVTKKKIFGKM
ncbi:hypothetical protein DFH07DRAFT_776718 [Mycena maculata]|uniref:Uncharacterized protein n=1 Tax=Mycena maculata TaxID=230809 RepID=A0AAD7N4T7_9AGAR|nr:hypothetical protein DFH07DRAFT_776718 [Mycena maculata]